MSIVVMDEYKIIQEDASESTDIAKRIETLMIDLGSDPALVRRLARQFAGSLEDSSSVSFVTAYKDYVIPTNFAGMALIQWLTPKENTGYLDSSDFCVPLFIAQKALPMFDGISVIMEEYIRTEAEARYLDHELRESLKQ